MNPDVLTQFLIDITRGALRDAYREHPEAVTAAAPLSDEMRIAIRNQDIAGLWTAGAHPMALIVFSRLCEWPGERYYACVTEAEAKRRAGPAGDIALVSG